MAIGFRAGSERPTERKREPDDHGYWAYRYSRWFRVPLQSDDAMFGLLIFAFLLGIVLGLGTKL